MSIALRRIVNISPVTFNKCQDESAQLVPGVISDH